MSINPELIWPDKTTQVKRPKLPFQDVEKLTEMRKLKQNRLDQFTEDDVSWPENYPTDWKNRLIWGDNKYIMSSLLKDGIKGDIDLIYIDPPFATGADFSIDIKVGDQEVTKEPSAIEELAYRDTWAKGLQSYLDMMYKRLVLMKDLLAQDGTIFVHTDYRVSSYLNILMDEIFGRDNQINEIIWCYKSGGIPSGNLPKKHDTIQWYSKGDDWTFNPLYTEYTEGTKERGLTDVKGDDYELREEGALMPDWWEIQPILSPTAYERTGFPTQKPEKLIKRIIKMASKEGDLVADFFCGSGTTGATAEKMGRRWIMTDLSKFAIQTARKRLLNLHQYSKNYEKPVRPFVVQNLGSYQKHKFIDNGHPPVEEYRKFILDLYAAQSINGYAFVHGRKGDTFVHIAGVDSVVTRDEVEDAANECANAIEGNELDVLGWDFELGLDNVVDDIEGRYGLNINLKLIPRAATELKQASEAGKDIKFFDLGYLEEDHEVDGNKLSLELTKFVLANPEYIPEEVEDKIQGFEDFIDYWAVDFDYRDDVFHNMWQSFRTPNDKSLDLKCSHKYNSPGKKKVFIKVIDVFGNDTNKVIDVDVGE